MVVGRGPSRGEALRPFPFLEGRSLFSEKRGLIPNLVDCLVNANTLTDGVTKVTEAYPAPFWHFWHLITLKFLEHAQRGLRL